MIEYIAYFFITAGIAVDFLAAVSLVRMPDVSTRLLSSTKLVTLGTSCLFFGVFLLQGLSAPGVKALLCILFILITSPVEAHALLKAARSSGIPSGKEAAEPSHGKTTEA